MSVQPIEIVDLLSGLEEHRSCEHGNHSIGKGAHADGGEVFVLINRACCSGESEVMVFCRRFIEHPSNVYCPQCLVVRSKSEAYAILGPANPAA